MNKLLVIIFILTFNCYANISEEKNEILQNTIPMVNIFKDYDRHLNISLDNIEIIGKLLIVRVNEIEYKYNFNTIGANFSKSSQISNKVNVYTQLDKVYYIESLNKFENYSVTAQLGSEFGKNAGITNYGFSTDYKFSLKTNFGFEFNGYSETGQINLALCYLYKYSKLINLKSGFEIHSNIHDQDLSKQFTFPEENKKYELNNSFYSSIFIEPALIFSAGNFHIRQGIKTRLFLMGGDINGIAYYMHPFVELCYIIF